MSTITGTLKNRKSYGLYLIFLSLFLLSLIPLSSSLGGMFPAVVFTFILGSAVYLYAFYHESPEGIKNNFLFTDAKVNNKLIAWFTGLFITGFYVLLYWYPETLTPLIRSFDPLSFSLRNVKADQWFLYGSFYTIAVLVMGLRMIIKYRHSRYQIYRTISVTFFQLVFAFIIPGLLKRMNEYEYYFSYFWPLKYDYLFPSTINSLMKDQYTLGIFMLVWGIVMFVVATPILTYYFGKRWYCSWVCGCGALAETAGDPYRQLSDKSLKAWKIERWMIHSVLVFVVLTTALLWFNDIYKGEILGSVSKGFSKTYGFVIGALFSGIAGVGLYPLMGSRVWCRFGCPMAAVLGILQKKASRFRITTNGGQCISCGNCSTYCEMGIDVRAYAQKGDNIVRASCVGCGICSAVCPRGVLKLENGPAETKFRVN